MNKIITIQPRILHFERSDWFTNLRLSTHILSHHIWKCITPTVAELKKKLIISKRLGFDDI